jgi:serine/threonine-protein kinase
MGAVYEARHLVTGRRCAVKVMLGHSLDRPELRDRFLHEARIAARIRSPHIVDILDAGIEERLDLPFLVMELLEGEDLAQRVQRRGPLSPPEVVACLWQVALALDKMHRAGIVHRDLKPRNLFATRSDDGSPLYKVVDFGVAKLVKTPSEQATQNVGTPLYMAPEQFLAEGRVGRATDIYALGMIAFLLLVGSHYWAEENRRSLNPFVFSRLVGDGPMEPATVRAARAGMELPAAFDAWFARATAVVPEARFETASEAITELALVLDVPAPLAGPDEIHAADGSLPDDTAAGGGPGAVTTQEPAAAGPTVRDGDATAASLAVTSRPASRSRVARRRVRSLLAVAALAVAISVGLVVRRIRHAPERDAATAAPAATPGKARPMPAAPAPAAAPAAGPIAPPGPGAPAPLDAGATIPADSLPVLPPAARRRAAPPRPPKDPRARLYLRD